MADIENSFNVELLKNTNILVYVDEALPDILVVTYKYGKNNIRQFRGVLLDTSKRNLPHGVTSLHPAFSSSPSTTAEDTLHSVNQRFLYTDSNITPTRPLRTAAKCKNTKMTVRLRPRQVLCTKCKGICNENSENVSRKRKSASEPETTTTPPPPLTKAPVISEKRTYMSTRSTAERNKQLKLQEQQEQQQPPTMIPHVTRLLPQDISNALNGNPPKVSVHTIGGGGGKQPLSEVSSSTFDGLTNVEHSKQQHSDCNSNVSISHVDVDSDVDVNRIGIPGEGIGKSGKRMALRKKHGIGSMEDLWDESVFEEATEKQPFSARTIKISFGSQGEGTVLKIPTKLHHIEDSEENIDMQQNCSDNLKDANTKAARRALKKAKKEARRKVLLNSSTSPPYTSPRGTIGGSSPRYTIGSASPRHGLGTTPGIGSSPTYESHVQPVVRRHKHKVKHKKKHREDKKHRCTTVTAGAEETTIKEECLKQKLSINLKRVNETYEPQSCSSSNDKSVNEDVVVADSAHDTAVVAGEDDNEGENNDGHEGEDEDGEDGQVPNFPPSPLLMRISAQALTSALGADGRCLTVGDIVWGKIQGFPWWPGKVLTITNAGVGPQAHVTWFGSTTSSLLQCDQLISFLENFKIRYNKKKRGTYREAIKQATCEAQYLQTSRPTVVTAVPPSLASPREIDVIS